MRILFLTSTFHPVVGGAETYAMALTRGLGALGNEVQIVTDMVPGEPATEVLARGVEVRRLHHYRKRFGAADTILWEQMQFGLRPELHAIASAFTPDIVFSNSLDLCVPAKLTSLATGLPWVATFHEQAPERDAMGVATLHLSYGLLEPDAVVAGSRFYLDRARRFGREDRCHLIYHGIDSDRFRPFDSSGEVRARYGIDRNQSLLVSTGRLKARKGFLDLVRAVSILLANGREVALIIAGTLNSASLAYLEDLKREVVALGLSDRVHFEDSLTNDRIPWLLCGSDIVVQASHEEGLGLSVIEAMSCGRPLVATRIPGHAEIVESEDQALLVEPGRPNDLALAIETLLNDAVCREKLGVSARARAVVHFSLQRMAESTAELLRAVVKRPISCAS